MLLPADKAGPVVRPVEWIHPATDLGAEHDVPARHAPDRRPAAMFGEAPPIERGRVEQIDAELECPLHRGDRGTVVQPRVEITKRRGSKSQNRDLKSRPAKDAARQCGHRNHASSPLISTAFDKEACQDLRTLS